MVAAGGKHRPLTADLWQWTVLRFPFAHVRRGRCGGVRRRLEGSGPPGPPAWPPGRGPGSAGVAGEKHRDQHDAAELGGGAAGAGRAEGPGSRSRFGSADPVRPRAAPAAGRARYCPASPHRLRHSPARLCGTRELLSPTLAPQGCLPTAADLPDPGSLGLTARRLSPLAKCRRLCLGPVDSQGSRVVASSHLAASRPPLSPVHITRCWKSILVPFTTFKRGSTPLPPAVSVSGSEKLPCSFGRWFCLAFSCRFFVWPCRGCRGGRERINWAPGPSVPSHIGPEDTGKGSGSKQSARPASLLSL